MTATMPAAVAAVAASRLLSRSMVRRASPTLARSLAPTAASLVQPRRKTLVQAPCRQRQYRLDQDQSESSHPVPPRKSLVQQPRRRVNGINGVNGSHAEEDEEPGFLCPKSALNNHRRFESDLVVVLDMDECLLHSQFHSQQNDYRQYEKRPSRYHNSCEHFNISLPCGDQVHVNKRPNLDLFLKYVTQKFETHIFTAAMEIYAKPVLDYLDPNNQMIQKRFYRERCQLDPKLGVYVKNLEKVLINGSNNFNEKRVVLVDNNPLSFLANPSNGILVSNFYDDPKDDTLFTVMDLLDELDKTEDVRPVLDDMFGLKNALKSVPKKAPLQ